MSESLSSEEISSMKEAGRALATILKKLGRNLKAGMTTKEVEQGFETLLKEYPGMEPAFKGFMGYPAALCVSINDEVIHGIPGPRVIKDADSVSIDLGIKYKGIFVDAARTYLVGRASPIARRLAKVALKALRQGIKRAKIGNRVGDISCAIQQFVEKNGFSVIRRFVGHGIGRSLHQLPEVPNFGTPAQGQQLFSGMALAIEPMVSSGTFEVEVALDGWTAKTKDGSLSAHFEDTVLVTERGPLVLTA